nr:helix-turn-helix domain-containing protein [Humibacillus sp. DSM 29435]
MFIAERTTREPKRGEPSPHLESRTRSRVLQMVSVDGPVTAAELGRHLDLTPAAVRRHLDALVEQGVVATHDAGTARRGRGRPARAYVVSEAGHSSLGADYDSVAVEVLRYLAKQSGPEAVAEFARSRTAEAEQRYAAALSAVGDDTADRADALVTALSEDGFAATARPVGAGALAGIQLCQGHCPVQHVAAEFPAFCEAETEAFSRLLGVHVQRLATLAGGHHVCTTFVPTGGLDRKSESPADVVTGEAHLVPTSKPAPPSSHSTHVKEGSPS